MENFRFKKNVWQVLSASALLLLPLMSYAAFVPCDYAKTEKSSVNSDYASVKHQFKAVDNNTETYSILQASPGLAGVYAEQRLFFNFRGYGGDTIVAELSFSTAVSNDMLDNITIAAYAQGEVLFNAGIPVSDLDLTFITPTRVRLSYIANPPEFDFVQIKLSSPEEDQQDEVRIHYASKQTPKPEAFDPHVRICPGKKAAFTGVSPLISYRWYSEPAGGTLLNSGKTFTTPVLTTSSTFYMEAVYNGCSSPVRTRVFAQVQPENGIVEKWNRTYGGPESDDVRKVIPLPGGGYLLGATKNNAIRLMKIGNLGNVVWDKVFESGITGSLNDIIITADGGYLIAGTDLSSGSSDYALLKISAAGDIQWYQKYGGTLQDISASLAAAPDGGYIIGGFSESNDIDVSDGNNGLFDYWIVKVDAYGNKIWDRSYGGSGYEYFANIVPAAGGGYILGGTTESNDGDVSEANNGATDIWMIKINESGNIIWDHTYGGSSYEIFSVTVADNDGGYVTGAWSSSSDGDVTDGNSGSTDMLIIKTDAEGNKLWDRTLGGDDTEELNEILPLPGGGYLLGGITYSELNGDVTDIHQGSGDYWVVKLDAARNKVWDATFGGSSDERLRGIVKSPDGGYLIAGLSFSVDGDVTDDNNGNGDIWLVKIAEPRCNSSARLEDEILTSISGEEFTAFPNPFTTELKVMLNADSDNVVKATLLDLNGKEILIREITSDNSGSEVFNTSEIEPGMYVLKVVSGDKTYVKKIIKL